MNWCFSISVAGDNLVKIPKKNFCWYFFPLDFFLGRVYYTKKGNGGKAPCELRSPRLKPSISSVNLIDLACNEDLPWQEIVLGTGSKGPIFAKDKCLKVAEVRNHNPGKDIWLYIRQLEDGSINYSLCNESPFATPEDIRKPAMMRWSIGQCFRECKKFLGMDHYVSRTWPAWRRHILFTFIAHLFICKLRNYFANSIDSKPIGPIV
jgi:hypothetical protein